MNTKKRTHADRTEKTNMKIVVKQTMPGVWTFTLHTLTGSAASRIPFRSADEAVEAAKAQHPNVEVDVEE